jgi:hypothetical protein
MRSLRDRIRGKGLVEFLGSYKFLDTKGEDKMILEEAIKELSYLRDGYLQLRWITETQAANLGIEALKFKQAIRDHTVDDFDALLPGETVKGGKP